MKSSEQPLRVGIFTDDFFPESGGVSRSIELQLQELQRAGHQVTLFAPGVHFTPPAAGAWVGLPYWRLPGTPSFLCSLQATGQVAARIAAEHRLDVVHSQNERGSLFLASRVARIAGVPHVHTFHSNYVGTHRTTPIASGLNSLTFLDWSSRAFARQSGGNDFRPRSPSDPQSNSDSIFAGRDWRSLARIAASVDAFTSPAGYLIDSIVDASGGALSERGRVVPSGVADVFRHAERQRPPGRIRLLSCGRLGPEKRVEAILAAFELLGRDDVELHIVGSGAAASSLKQQASRINHGTVRFLGHFDDATAIAQEIADADIFVLASHRFDTQGMVLAEAAAAGTAILYCDDRLRVGVAEQNSLLTGPSPKELAAGLAELVDDPARLAQMSTSSREIGAALTLEAMTQAYLASYRLASQLRRER